MMAKEVVYGLYDQGWKDMIVPDAYSHPAKFSRKLAYWIVKTGIERGWWKPGDTILDPFAGVGLGGMVCAASGLQWLGIELEERFVALAQQNFDLHRKDWETMGKPLPQIIQGDSRRLGEIVQGIGGAVTSPPYAEIRQGSKEAERGQEGGPLWATYGSTPGQLGAMPEGSLGGITSPPYGELDPSASHAQGTSRKDPKSKNYRPVAERDWEERETPRRYSAITSPPFSQPETRDRHPVQEGSVSDAITRTPTVDRQGESDGNIASLGGITSPPYEASMNAGVGGIDWEKARRPERTIFSPTRHSQGTLPTRYSEAADNLGNSQGETYWQAIDLILRQLYDLFPPGGVLAWVVKPFVRNKKLVDLPQMTLDLMRSQGWELVVWVDAMLIAGGIQLSGFPEMVPEYQKKKVSFFRRLAERKGSPRIDAETVLVVRKG